MKSDGQAFVGMRGSACSTGCLHGNFGGTPPWAKHTGPTASHAAKKLSTLHCNLHHNTTVIVLPTIFAISIDVRDLCHDDSHWDWLQCGGWHPSLFAFLFLFGLWEMLLWDSLEWKALAKLFGKCAITTRENMCQHWDPKTALCITQCRISHFHNHKFLTNTLCMWVHTHSCIHTLGYDISGCQAGSSMRLASACSSFCLLPHHCSWLLIPCYIRASSSSFILGRHGGCFTNSSLQLGFLVRPSRSLALSAHL